MIQKTILLVVSIAMLTACSKDDDKDATVKIPDESPMETLNTALGFENNWQTTTDFSVHRGYLFKPKKNGNIMAFTIKIPTIQSGDDAIIRLWDRTTGTMIFNQTVSISIANYATTIDIETPITLDKTHEYILTKSSEYYYRHFNPDTSAGNFPVTLGSIEFVCSVYETGDALPDDSFASNTYGGDIGFVFRPTE